MTDERRIVGIICEVLLITGGINWGLVGLCDFNLVHFLFSSVPALERAVYALVGLSGLYILYRLIKREMSPPLI